MTDKVPAVVFFDFDGTLTSGDTLVPFLRKVCGPFGLLRGMAASFPWLAGYALKLVPNDRAKERLLYTTIRGRSESELRNTGAHFARQVIPGMLRSDTMARLHRHLEGGDECVLVSASPNIYLEPWAYQAGFKAVLSSAFEFDASGHATGHLSGENCYGQEKVKRVQRYLQERGGASLPTVAYGDTAGDIPLLKFVSEGYFVKKSYISVLE